jgi:hypothetical protein
MKDAPPTRGERLIEEVAQKHGGLASTADGLFNSKDLEFLVHEVADIAVEESTKHIRHIESQAILTQEKRDRAEHSLHTIGCLAGSLKDQNKASIDQIRLFRMTIDSEIAMIDKAIGKLKALNVQPEIEKIQKLCDLLSDPKVKAIMEAMNDKAG